MRSSLVIGCILTASITLQAGLIISQAGGGALTIQASKDYYRNVSGYWDNRGGGTFTETFHCRFYRNGPSGKHLPLVVMFISWGGTIDGTESAVQYEDMMNDPFMTMVVKPEYNGGDDNPSNWYRGNRWTDTGGRKRSVPWAYSAVVGMINDIKRSNRVLSAKTVLRD